MVLDYSTSAIVCKFDALRGYGVVPGALMRATFACAPAEDCASNAGILIVREFVTHATAGDYDLEIHRVQRRSIRLMMQP